MYNFCLFYSDKTIPARGASASAAMGIDPLAEIFRLQHERI